MTTRRISVTLDLPEQQAIELFGDPTRPEHATLEAFAATRGLTLRDESDAAVLRTLIRAGVEALREQALEQGYERLAEAQEADREERRARRNCALARHAE